jgi:hydroxypyruvate reductase
MPVRDTQTQQLLLGAFQAAVQSADPRHMLAAHLPAPPTTGRTRVVGAGKAAASMAAAVEAVWPADAPLDGLVITRYEHGLPLQRIRCIEAGHPVPDAAGEQAAREILAQAMSLSPGDLLLVLISGGGSSLMALPVASVPMSDLKAVTQALLRSGAPIQEMNVVRKHLSQVQGGRLAAVARARGARVLALMISDVAGDDLSSIASGPTVPDPSRYEDALAILTRWGITPPESVLRHLQTGVEGEVGETPKPGDPLFEGVENRLIATAQQSLQAAAAHLAAAGYHPMVLGDTVTGEAREVAKVYAALLRQIVYHGQPVRGRIALISGGECTVTVKGSGRGGRCSEFLLSLYHELAGEHLAGARIHALAADTDGIDGSERNAGAWFGPTDLAEAHNARHWLDCNDAWGFFNQLGTLIHTGPTRTNVNDCRIILIDP